MVRILSLNVRGLNNHFKQDMLKIASQDSKVDMVLIEEPKMSKDNLDKVMSYN